MKNVFIRIATSIIVACLMMGTAYAAEGTTNKKSVDEFLKTFEAAPCSSKA